MKFRVLSFLLLVSIASLFLSFILKQESSAEEKLRLNINSIYQKHIQNCLNALSLINSKQGIDEKQIAYLEARKQFKHLEPIIAYTSNEIYESLNQANIIGVEELGNQKFEIEDAFGFQVIEELLYSGEANHDIDLNVKKTSLLLNELKKDELQLSKDELLDLIRHQIIRVATLGITGFDSPEKQSLQESIYTYKTIKHILTGTKGLFNEEPLYQQWIDELNQMPLLLNQDFNSFNRYLFIKDHSHKQLELVLETAKDWEVSLPSEAAFKPEMTSLFTSSSFQANYFVKSDYAYSDERSELGKVLFKDKNLSKNGNLSCESCHQEDKAFTDGMVHFENQVRNTPTLLYSVLQNDYFFDMRSANIREQITQVVENPVEFHTDLKTIVQKIMVDTSYAKKFDKAYNKNVNERLFLDALSQYLKTLNPFNSKFDKNINGIENSLSESEINGFNLFMGKAECGTCHFAPIFNGTVPPYFTTTEMELIGVPKDSSNKELDPDYGRYNVHQTENRKHFFKTPTVRNVSKTAPYMHNGVYHSLFEVVEFYDDGGGLGLGFDLPFQTLPSDSLHLSETEIEDLIAFMNSLEDS